MSPKATAKKGHLFSAQDIRDMCLEAGADDAGFVDLRRESMAPERSGILGVYPRTRSIISLVKVMNRENIQSPARYVSNDEYHGVGDEFSAISRKVLRLLNPLGIRGLVPTKSWPMDLHRWPGKIWDISHKIIASEAGVGKMGLNRLVLHPRHGAFIQLQSILIDAELDAYGQPLTENPCINCNLCAAVCPTGAITKGESFDFFACNTHNYRDNMIGFQNWVEAMIASRDMAEYHARFNVSETAFMWQSLMFRLSYRCSYCVAVCPAGEEVKPLYLKSKSAYVKEILKPLQERVEPVYVIAGTRAETAAARNPRKEVKRV